MDMTWPTYAAAGFLIGNALTTAVMLSLGLANAGTVIVLGFALGLLAGVLLQRRADL